MTRSETSQIVSGRAASGHRRQRWLLGGTGLVAVLAFLAVDTYPMIGNDSIAYLSHSQNLTGTGFVQFGYRQFGYPLWLAIWRWVGSQVEPLALTSLVQRLALFVVTALAVWRVRLAGLILVGLLLVPSFIAYSNVLLTEAVGIPLAALAGVLTVIILERAGLASEHGGRSASTWLTIGAAFVAVALATVRFHYVLLAVVLLAALLWSAWRQPHTRIFVIGSVLVSTSLIGAAFLLMSAENKHEYGEFFPTVRGERVQFWMLWQVLVEPDRPHMREKIPQIFLDGNPYTYIYQVDALPYEDVKRTYAESAEVVLEAANTSIWEERAKTAAAVFVGGRVDDNLVATVVRDVLPGQLDQRIHRNYYAREYGIEAFNEDFNDGRVTRAGLISSGPIPQLPMPHATAVFRWLVPLSIVTLLVGLLWPESRQKAFGGLAILVAHVALAGWFILDIFRYLLPAYVAIVVLAAATATDLWPRIRDGFVAHASSESTKGVPGSRG